jgi:hypothetical protein
VATDENPDRIFRDWLRRVFQLSLVTAFTNQSPCFAFSFKFNITLEMVCHTSYHLRLLLRVTDSLAGQVASVADA